MMHRNKEKHAAQEQTVNKTAAQGQCNEGMKRFSVGNYWGANEAFEWAMRLDPETLLTYFTAGSPSRTYREEVTKLRNILYKQSTWIRKKSTTIWHSATST